jgi:S-DNA-T family DNA segregation ATPase FtsK/SpoIIIE
MAALSKAQRARAAAAEEAPLHHAPIERVIWLVGAVLWGLLAASLISYSPADPPGHAVITSASSGVQNWIGPVGAAVSHHIFLMLGSGAWILVLSAGAYLGYIAYRGTVDHAAVRALGVLLVALAFSGFHALLAPEWSSQPQGGGGLVAIVGVHEMTVRFGGLGAGLWIGLIGAIGLTVAYDRWLIVVPRAIGSGMGVAMERSRTAAEAARTKLKERTVRANDVDDDEDLAAMTATMRRAVQRQKQRDAEEEKPAKKTRKAPVVVEDEVEAYDEDEEYEYEDAAPEDEIEDDAEAYEDDEAEDEEDEAVPGAPQVFTADELREKISKLPVRFANASKKMASEDDLESLRAQRRSEEEADRRYVFPGLDLLEDPEENYAEELESYVREQAEALENALQTYRINGEVVGIDSGPVITLYQVRLAPGTKVNKVTAVSSDLARMLKATNIRIVPNTEGLDTVGIEVPNSRKEKVRLKELMATTEKTARMKLPLFLGKDASGNPLVVDLASLPHMLIAGTTGSGKSVCMNAIIMGFLYTQKPSDLKLVLVDPKMVELSQFKDIPHLMCPVVTEMSKATAILEWAVTKMDERYELLAEAGCRDINAYNGLGWEELRERLQPSNEIEEAKIPRKMPYMVFVIDELADLMMTNKEVETSIVRIAQKARAVGIHLILATQRPQANVVTGLIKSNMPGRLSFKVASGMDSRIVLDQKGGELLLGQGDMLMLTPRSAATFRAQGTLVDDMEIRKVVRFIRDHADQNFEGALVAISNHGYEAEAHEDRMRESAQEDPLFDRAVELVLESQRGSVSMLQRRLAIGYTRSARLIEMMGDAGIIGRHKGTVAREVTMTLDEWRAMKDLAEQQQPDEDETGQTQLFAEPKDAAAVEEPPFDVPAASGTDVETGELGALVDAGGMSASERHVEAATDLDEGEEDAVALADAEEAEEEEEWDEEDAAPDASDEEVEEEEDDAEVEAEYDDEEYEEEDESPEGEAEEYDEEEEEVEASDDDADAEEEEADEEEYEYEYVDEDGNPVDPEDMDEEDGEYEYEEEEEDAVAEEEDETSPQISTAPLTRRESAA